MMSLMYVQHGTQLITNSIAIGAVYFVVSASIAELASAIPSSAGGK
jgi:hypothetical protein